MLVICFGNDLDIIDTHTIIVVSDNVKVDRLNLLLVFIILTLCHIKRIDKCKW